MELCRGPASRPLRSASLAFCPKPGYKSYMRQFAAKTLRAITSAGNGVGKTAWVAGFTLLVAVWLAFRGPQGIQSLIEKHREISALEQQNAEKVRQNEALRERIQRLEQSGSEQELEIRKQLKLLRPGETTFLLPDPPKSSDAPTPAQ